MYEYHDQYKRAYERGDAEAAERWTNQLRWEVARHAVGEEIIVYPLMEQHLGEKGKKLADHDREEHLVRHLQNPWVLSFLILTDLNARRAHNSTSSRNSTNSRACARARPSSTRCSPK